MRIVINASFGGFSVSLAVMERLGIPPTFAGGPLRQRNYLSNADLGLESENPFAYRADPRLVEAVEALGSEAASGRMATLAVVEIPDEVDWEIEAYDGLEHVAERHRTWWG